MFKNIHKKNPKVKEATALIKFILSDGKRQDWQKNQSPKKTKKNFKDHLPNHAMTTPGKHFGNYTRDASSPFVPSDLEGKCLFPSTPNVLANGGKGSKGFAQTSPSRRDLSPWTEMPADEWNSNSPLKNQQQGLNWRDGYDSMSPLKSPVRYDDYNNCGTSPSKQYNPSLNWFNEVGDEEVAEENTECAYSSSHELISQFDEVIRKVNSHSPKKKKGKAGEDDASSSKDSTNTSDSPTKKEIVPENLNSWDVLGDDEVNIEEIVKSPSPVKKSPALNSPKKKGSNLDSPAKGTRLNFSGAGAQENPQGGFPTLMTKASSSKGQNTRLSPKKGNGKFGSPMKNQFGSSSGKKNPSSMEKSTSWADITAEEQNMMGFEMLTAEQTEKADDGCNSPFFGGRKKNHTSSRKGQEKTSTSTTGTMFTPHKKGTASQKGHHKGAASRNSAFKENGNYSKGQSHHTWTDMKSLSDRYNHSYSTGNGNNYSQWSNFSTNEHSNQTVGGKNNNQPSSKDIVDAFKGATKGFSAQKGGFNMPSNMPNMPNGKGNINVPRNSFLKGANVFAPQGGKGTMPANNNWSTPQKNTPNPLEKAESLKKAVEKYQTALENGKAALKNFSDIMQNSNNSAQQGFGNSSVQGMTTNVMQNQDNMSGSNSQNQWSSWNNVQNQNMMMTPEKSSMGNGTSYNGHWSAPAKTTQGFMNQNTPDNSMGSQNMGGNSIGFGNFENNSSVIDTGSYGQVAGQDNSGYNNGNNVNGVVYNNNGNSYDNTMNNGMNTASDGSFSANDGSQMNSQYNSSYSGSETSSFNQGNQGDFNNNQQQSYTGNQLTNFSPQPAGICQNSTDSMQNNNQYINCENSQYQNNGNTVTMVRTESVTSDATFIPNLSTPSDAENMDYIKRVTSQNNGSTSMSTDNTATNNYTSQDNQCNNFSQNGSWDNGNMSNGSNNVTMQMPTAQCQQVPQIQNNFSGNSSLDSSTTNFDQNNCTTQNLDGSFVNYDQSVQNQNQMVSNINGNSWNQFQNANGFTSGSENGSSFPSRSVSVVTNTQCENTSNMTFNNNVTTNSFANNGQQTFYVEGDQNLPYNGCSSSTSSCVDFSTVDNSMNNTVTMQQYGGGTMDTNGNFNQQQNCSFNTNMAFNNGTTTVENCQNNAVNGNFANNTMQLAQPQQEATNFDHLTSYSAQEEIPLVIQDGIVADFSRSVTKELHSPIADQ